MDLQIDYIDAVACAKKIVNDQLNIERNKFMENRKQQNKEKYLELINDMKKINMLDRETVEKYLKNEEKLMIKKKVDFCIGIFDNLSDASLEKIKNDIKNSEIYGIGVYTDRVVIENFLTYPKNSLEKRMEIAQNIDGVEFVFALDTNNPEELKKTITKETTKIMQQKNM